LWSWTIAPVTTYTPNVSSSSATLSSVVDADGEISERNR
jgi:hypothetical protein